MSSSYYQESVISLRYCVEIVAALGILLWVFSGFVDLPEENCQQVAKEIELADPGSVVADCFPQDIKNPISLPAWAQILYIPSGLFLAIFLLWNRGRPNYFSEILSAFIAASVLIQMFILLVAV